MAIEKSNISANGAAPVAKDKESRRARAAYVEERSKIVRPIEKRIKKWEEEIQKQEALAAELEQNLVEASEKNDGALISQIAKDLGEAKKKTDEAYEEWEKASAELEEAQKKYPL